MCKTIPVERCICFLFLTVSLVVFICSGFPIDDVMAMTSPNRYRPRTATTTFYHRLRHSRISRTQTSRTSPSGHIEATVFQNETYAPVPRSLTKTMVATRSQRSSPSRKHRQHSCPPLHFTSKAYKSQIVLLVKVQGYERTNYTVSFLLIGKLKAPPNFPIHECLTLQFSNGTGPEKGCERGRRGRRKNLVKADIQGSQEYFLFLNTSRTNKCFPSYSPEKVPVKKKDRNYMEKVVRRVCGPKFNARSSHITTLEDKSSWKRSREKQKVKLKLVCKVEGLPMPWITWKRDNVTLVNDTRVRIKHVKRRSILVIRRPSQDDYGWYECVATAFDGTAVSRGIKVLAPDTERECQETAKSFCMGHGKCYNDYNNELYCVCDDGYIGERCEEKTTGYVAKRNVHNLKRMEHREG